MVLLTPVDITNKEFKRSVRGYNEYEVDSFLDQLARDYEELYRKKLELEEALQLKENQLAQYKSMEETMNNALVLAQKTSEEVKQSAQREAELLLKETRAQAEEILRQAALKKEMLEQEETRARQAFYGFKAQIRGFLQAQLEMMESFGVESADSRAEAAAAKEPGLD